MSDLNSHSAAESGGSSHDHAQIKPRGKSYSRQIDWRLVALVGASVALGAGVALLTAPQSGEHTRLAMASKLRHSRPRQQSPWEKLSNELQKAARRKRFRRAASSERSASRDRY